MVSLQLFRGRCGHQWVGALEGHFACPVCGDYDGDHHVVSMDEIAVQPHDLSGTWEEIIKWRDKEIKENEKSE